MATTSPTTAISAGVKTPGSGAYSDPAQVGAMIQKMYPQYANFDATTLGQRWIDVHTPQATAGDTTGATDVLQAPTGTTPLTSTDPNQNTPDLSGLGQFASPVKQQPAAKPQTPIKINLPAATVGMGQTMPAPQNNTPWLGSQIADWFSNKFAAPKLNIKSSSDLGL